MVKSVWFTKNGYGEMMAHLERPERLNGELRSGAEFPVPNVALGRCVCVSLLGYEEAPTIEVPVNERTRQAEPVVKAPVTKTKTKTAAATLAPRTCEVCGEEYQPMRKDNRFCSPACGNAGKKLYKKEPVAAPKQAAPVRVVQDMPTVSTDRLAAIRAAARRMDGLPEED